MEHDTAGQLAFTGCSVMSVTHSWFGPSRPNCRFTRSLTVSGAGWLRLPRRRVGRPANPARLISGWTVLWPTLMPLPWTSSACTRSRAWVPLEAAWIAAIRSVSQAWRINRVDGARPVHS